MCGDAIAASVQVPAAAAFEYGFVMPASGERLEDSDFDGVADANPCFRLARRADDEFKMVAVLPIQSVDGQATADEVPRMPADRRATARSGRRDGDLDSHFPMRMPTASSQNAQSVRMFTANKKIPRPTKSNPRMATAICHRVDGCEAGVGSWCMFAFDDLA